MPEEPRDDKPAPRETRKGFVYWNGRWWPAWAALFIPFLFVFWWLYRIARDRVNWKAAFATVALFELVVFPAEMISVARGHWVYNEARIFGPRLFGVPIEEPLIYYLFSPLIIIAVMEAVQLALEKRGKR